MLTKDLQDRLVFAAQLVLHNRSPVMELHLAAVMKEVDAADPAYAAQHGRIATAKAKTPIAVLGPATPFEI